MRPRIHYIGTLIVGLGLWAVFVQIHNQTLREEVAGSRARLEDLERLEGENVRLKGMITRQQNNENELQQLRQEARDVVRLRGEVTSLRNLQHENQKLTTEIYQFSNQLQTVIQIANDWRNYKTTAMAGTLLSGPTELIRHPAEETASPALSERQLTGTKPADSSQNSQTAQALPGLMAPIPGSSAELGQGPGSLPADHAKFSNQDCASCHGGAVGSQGRIEAEALLGTEETFLSRH